MQIDEVKEAVKKSEDEVLQERYEELTVKLQDGGSFCVIKMEDYIFRPIFMNTSIRSQTFNFRGPRKSNSGIFVHPQKIEMQGCCYFSN